MNMPVCSVIVPVFKGAEGLDTTLRSVRAQDVQLVLVQEDQTLWEMVDEGVALAEGEWLSVVMPGTRLLDGWLSRLLRESKGAAAVHSDFRFLKGDEGVLLGNEGSRKGPGASVIVRHSVWLTTGPAGAEDKWGRITDYGVAYVRDVLAEVQAIVGRPHGRLW